MKDIYFSVRSNFSSNILAQSQLNSDKVGLRYLIRKRTVTFLPGILYATNFKDSVRVGSDISTERNISG